MPTETESNVAATCSDTSESNGAKREQHESQQKVMVVLMEILRFAETCQRYFNSLEQQQLQQHEAPAAEEGERVNITSYTCTSALGNFMEDEGLSSTFLLHTNAFQFFIALGEAERTVDELAQTTREFANFEDAPGLATAARAALARARDAYVLCTSDYRKKKDERFQSEEDDMLSESGTGQNMVVNDYEDRPMKTGALTGKEVHSMRESYDDVVLVSDAEIEAWKWEALSADSEAPTVAEGGVFETFDPSIDGASKKNTEQHIGSPEKHCVSGVESIAAAHEQRLPGRVDDLKTFTGGQQSVVCTGDSKSLENSCDKLKKCTRFEIDSNDVKTLVNTYVTEEKPQVKQKTDAFVPSEKPFKNERESLLTTNGRGIRNRRGKFRRGERYSAADMSIAGPGSDFQEEEEETVTEELLELTQEMKREATRYGEVLQRDNDRLERTSATQQRHLDDTRQSTNQTRSLLKGKGFGFLYAMLLLVIGCVLFVFMIFFLCMVRG